MLERGRVFSREGCMDRACDFLTRVASREDCRIIDLFGRDYFENNEASCRLANFETFRLREDGDIYNDSELKTFNEWYGGQCSDDAKSAEDRLDRSIRGDVAPYNEEVFNILRGECSKKSSYGSLRVIREEKDTYYMIMFLCEGFSISDLKVKCADGMLRVFGSRSTDIGTDEVSRMVPVKGADSDTMVYQMVRDVLVVTLQKRR